MNSCNLWNEGFVRNSNSLKLTSIIINLILKSVLQPTEQRINYSVTKQNNIKNHQIIDSLETT